MFRAQHKVGNEWRWLWAKHRGAGFARKEAEQRILTGEGEICDSGRVEDAKILWRSQTRLVPQGTAEHAPSDRSNALGL